MSTRVLKSNESNGLVMEVRAPHAWEVGEKAVIHVSLKNLTGQPLVLPSRYCTNETRIHVALAGRGHIITGCKAASPPDQRDLVSLGPGGMLVSGHEIVPAISGMCTLNVGFSNSWNTAIFHNVGTKCCSPQVVPDIWQGGVYCKVMVHVAEPSQETIDAALQDFRKRGTPAVDRAKTLNSLFATPSELSVQVLLQHAASLPTQDSLRAHCIETVMARILKGIGVERIANLLVEARQRSSPQALRLALIEGFGEILRQPERDARFAGNWVSVKVAPETQQAIRTTLEGLLADPDTRIAEAAKAALKRRQG